MRIAIGSDHVGYALKAALTAVLEADGHMVLDLGAFSTDPVDYPDYARVVGQAVLRGFADTGVLVCASGVGAAMAANKIRGVRAAPCTDPATARETREEQAANVLCLSARALDGDGAIEVTRAWLEAEFSGDEIAARQVAKLAQLETVSTGPGTEAARTPAPTPAPRPATARPRTAAGPPPAATSPLPPLPAAPDPEPVTAAAKARTRPLRDALELPLVEDRLAFLESQDFLDRLWVKDPSLWRGDEAAVRNRLAWLTTPAVMRGHVDELRAFADEVRRLQFSRVLLLGTGGASLTAGVFNTTFRSKMGFPDLAVLDSTDPAAVKRALDGITLGRALFVVASKSGTTIETLAFHSYFRARVEAAAQKPGMHFIAITDPGSPLERLATEDGFRRTFLESPSIGGGYSALSVSGLVPAALIGVDVKALLGRAQAMVETCGNGGVRDNPAVRLGAALAGLAEAGRDKVTFLISEPIKALGAWIERLLAESLGKDGKGFVPVVDEPLGDPVVYGTDRAFVALVLAGDTSFDDLLDALDQADHPVIRIELEDPLDVGAEIFRWEMAAATAGAVLGVNPFDAPAVSLAAERTAALLSSWRRVRRLPDWPAEAEEDGVEITTRRSPRPGSVGEGLGSHLAQAGAEDYVAIQAYLPPGPDTWSGLQALRVLVRDRLRIATTAGFGPRHLSAMGQLQKGGRPNGLFIQIVGEDKDDLAIPGADYGFSTLKAAQALGDLEALREAGCRVIRLRLAGNPAQGLQQVLQIARAATRKL